MVVEVLAGMGIGGVGGRGGGLAGVERYVLITFLSCGLSIHWLTSLRASSPIWAESLLTGYWLTFQFSTVQYIYVATLKSMAA